MKQTDLLVKMVIDRWNGSIVNLNKHVQALSDEQLQKEVAPGKNRGSYILGHLIAVHDDMLRLLDMGEKLFPELYEIYIKQADKVATQTPSGIELRAMLDKQNSFFQEKFESLTSEEWLEKHTAVSEEDFLKEPQRNKLNILITRTSHLQYHLGQLVLLS
ncbi:MAG: hypothetical protein CFE21_03620 [Bacteroidetes bacterium B1(2017)]|nr:MAG: hypothetical protein CFE21_03620 [Bacteroidetes bacterium B1(2017)]